MNIVYCGHFDNTGYGEACQGYVNALITAGYNVIARHIPLNGPPSNNLSNKIKECLSKPSLPSKYCIQHTLPVYWQYSPNFEKNFGLFVYETDSLVGTGWDSKVQKMDGVIVANQNTYELCRQFNKNVYKIPHAFDINKYNRKYKASLTLPDTFKFYTIGEFSVRKNFETLIKAFHIAFRPNERVDLIIKTNRSGVHPKELYKRVFDFCGGIKKGLKLYGNNLDYYKQEKIITERLSDEQLGYLHQQCQVFVNSSHGEGFSIPTFDAMAFGKGVINFSNDCDYLTNDNIKQTDYCYDAIDTLPNLYTGKHKWNSNSVADYVNAMQKIYREYNSEKSINNRKENVSNSELFSYYNVGKMFQSVLV